MTETKPGPLDGIKILDLSTVLLGPYAGQIMGDLGADVIRVESPQSDITRWSGDASQPGFGFLFMNANRNKRSLCLNLKKDGAKEILTRMIKEADVFLHNIRLDAIERLGFGYEDVKAIKEDIVYVHAVGYGSDGPYAGQPAYDDLIQAAGGGATLGQYIDGDEDPKLIPTLIADKTSGLHCAYALLAALFHRERTGQGQYVEVPMLESFVSFLMMDHMGNRIYEPERGIVGYHKVSNPNRRPYKTSDGYIYIMPMGPDVWAKLFTLGDSDIAPDDPMFTDMDLMLANLPQIYEAMHAMTKQKTTQEWYDLLSANDIPVMYVNDIDGLMDDPHLKAVNMFESRSHHRETGYISTKHPIKFSETPASVRRDPPGLGEHNREILLEYGYSDEEVDALEEGRVLRSL
ncbi:MAG: CoA transferase [Alphaproteobacteria bacterium]|nr:MAG: CoA transferase [Alphaproteobacteria bacterium]